MTDSTYQAFRIAVQFKLDNLRFYTDNKLYSPASGDAMLLYHIEDAERVLQNNKETLLYAGKRDFRLHIESCTEDGRWIYHKVIDHVEEMVLL